MRTLIGRLMMGAVVLFSGCVHAGGDAPGFSITYVNYRTGVDLPEGSVRTDRGVGARVSTTYVNYKSGVGVMIEDVVTDSGYHLLHGGYLGESATPWFGKTLASALPVAGLPEWVEFRWKELELAREQSRQEVAALPTKTAKVMVRPLLPASVMAELAESPKDPAHPYLSLKSLELYYVWTTAGVKVHWRAHQGCCSVIHEGGADIGN